jgi:deoxyhypusine monooxygenase
MTIQIPDGIPSTKSIQMLSSVLNNPSLALSLRFRALFSLKSINTLEAIQEISKGFQDNSNLLKHEIAYVLGQMKNTESLQILYQVLADKTQDAMVRHEAAEAIGAIGKRESIVVLEEFRNDDEQVVRETVELAIDGLNYHSGHMDNNDGHGENMGLTHNGQTENNGNLNGQTDNDGNHNETVDDNNAINDSNNITSNNINGEKEFGTIDPAPAEKNQYSTNELTTRLLDTNLSLFQRYKAMFALRNRGDVEAVEGLCRGFDDDSALFRHEIGMITKAVPPLRKQWY